MNDELLITSLQYGPYDNGYVLVGLNSGKLLVYEPTTLDRVNTFNVFNQEAITKISIEPTELVFLAGEKGSVAGLSIIKKEMHYVYLDLGNR